jgi:hypothetical protein
MNYIAIAFNIFVLLYSMPFATAAIMASHGLHRLSFLQKLEHLFVVSLVVTFPIANFLSATMIYFYGSFLMSYVVLVYSILFVLIYYFEKTKGIS